MLVNEIVGQGRRKVEKNMYSVFKLALGRVCSRWFLGLDSGVNCQGPGTIGLEVKSKTQKISNNWGVGLEPFPII